MKKTVRRRALAEVFRDALRTFLETLRHYQMCMNMAIEQARADVTLSKKRDEAKMQNEISVAKMLMVPLAARDRRDPTKIDTAILPLILKITLAEIQKDDPAFYSEIDKSFIKVQRVYRGYRSRRNYKAMRTLHKVMDPAKIQLMRCMGSKVASLSDPDGMFRKAVESEVTSLSDLRLMAPSDLWRCWGLPLGQAGRLLQAANSRPFKTIQ